MNNYLRKVSVFFFPNWSSSSQTFMYAHLVASHLWDLSLFILPCFGKHVAILLSVLYSLTGMFRTFWMIIGHLEIHFCTMQFQNLFSFSFRVAYLWWRHWGQFMQHNMCAHSQTCKLKTSLTRVHSFVLGVLVWRHQFNKVQPARQYIGLLPSSLVYEIFALFQVLKLWSVVNLVILLHGILNVFFPLQLLIFVLCFVKLVPWLWCAERNFSFILFFAPY